METCHMSLHANSNNNTYAAPERFAKAEPGGLPMRNNLIERA